MSNLQESASVKQAENAITFINKEVLKPEAKPMSGMANPMIDQAAGMMAQDLQSFLKGFEQIGLVALAKLANNILTYGNYFPPVPPKGDGNGGSTLSSQPQNLESGQKAITDLLKWPSEYAKDKANLVALLGKMNTDNEYKGISSKGKDTEHASPIQSKSDSSNEKNKRRRIRNPFKKTNKDQR